MQLIPLMQVERQSLSILVENTQYEISVKDCNGIMAVTIVRDSVTVVENRRAVASVPVIPAGPRETGNFIFSTQNGDLPYWDQFGGTQQFFYLTVEEMEAFRGE